MKTQDTTHKYQNEQVNSAIQYVEHVRNHSYTEYVRQRISEVAAQKDLEEAELKGREQGRQERDREIAKNLLSDGLSIDRVAKSTGLSAKEIKQISKE